MLMSIDYVYNKIQIYIKEDKKMNIKVKAKEISDDVLQGISGGSGGDSSSLVKTARCKYCGAEFTATKQEMADRRLQGHLDNECPNKPK